MTITHCNRLCAEVMKLIPGMYIYNLYEKNYIARVFFPMLTL